MGEEKILSENNNNSIEKEDETISHCISISCKLNWIKN